MVPESPLTEKNHKIANSIKSFWDSPDAKNLFAPSKPDLNRINFAISFCVDLLQNIIDHPELIVKHIDKVDEYKMSFQEACSIKDKFTYLRQAYIIAL